MSIEELNKMLRFTTKGRIKSYITDNDKEPMWDGNIYVYSVSGSDKKKDFLFRIPVQVKSKLVTKFDNKFVSYPIEKVCLNGYFNDGGIIYFVVEIKVDEDGNYETRIFYKILSPSILKNILEDIEGNQETKNVHINKILDKKIDFFEVCKQFDKIRKIESIDALNNVIPIEKILGKEINIETISGLNDVLNGDYCSYYIDENNIKVPVRLPGKFMEYTIYSKGNIALDGKTYFNNWNEHKNSTGESFITFGDTIEIKNNKLSILKSEDNIYERYKTIDYFINIISKENVIKEKDLININILKDEKRLIEEIFEICDKFDINKESLRLKDIKSSDFRAIEILSEVKDDKIDTESIKELKCEIVEFVNYKISLFKVIYDNGTILYHNLYSNKIDLCVMMDYENRKVDISKFILTNEILLNTSNFNEKIILDTLKPIRKENSEIEADAYNRLMLNLIKAWDLNAKEEYINLIMHLEKILDGYIEEDIYFINKAQVEYRLNNRLNQKTIENLYRIKFKDNIKKDIKCAIYILLEDYKSFEEIYSELSDKEQENFEDYPIYSLYKNRYKNAQISS